MRNIALLGAGFSFNWGGWLANEVFEYLIGTPEVLANPALRDLLWRHRSHGFEDALAELQRDILAKPGLSLDVTTSNNKLPLRALFDSFQSAVTRMFDEMNAGYMNGQHFWRPDRARSIGDFLPRFDAIFTLNQDLLLEHLYVLELARTGSEKWNGAELPGMQRASRVSERGGELDLWSDYLWEPLPQEHFNTAEATKQPIYKLHGSSNWRTASGDPMLIIGGEKTRSIEQFPMLDWYAEQFRACLAQGSRLMVIGYSFRDKHINSSIEQAGTNGSVQLFVVDPNGAGVSVDADGQRLFKRALIGASRRSITDTLRDDGAEAGKLLRFLSK